MPRNTDFQPLETRPMRKHSGALVKLKNFSSIILSFSERDRIPLEFLFSFIPLLLGYRFHQDRYRFAIFYHDEKAGNRSLICRGSISSRRLTRRRCQWWEP